MYWENDVIPALLAEIVPHGYTVNTVELRLRDKVSELFIRKKGFDV
jgi:hypothetical protein